MPWSEILGEIFFGSLNMVFKLIYIIIPLMLILEIADRYNILNYISRILAPFVKIFSLPPETGLPLLVGQIFGLTYGAGLIIQKTREDEISTESLIILTVFLALCHAIIEDTLLFVTIGGKALIIAGVRILSTIIVTYLFSKIIK